MAGEYAAGDETIDGRGFLPAFGLRWHWIAAATFAALIASAAFLLVFPPRYAGTAVALLDEPQGSASGPAESLASIDLARTAIARLGLAENPEFGGGGASDPGAVEAFLARLNIAPSPSSRAVAITFVSRDPALAALSANTVAELVVQSRNEARARAVKARDDWLQQKIQDWKGKVADADAKVEALRAQSLLASGGGGHESAGDEDADLNEKLSAARAAEAAAVDKAERLRRLEREGRFAEAPPAIADESMLRLIEQRAAVKAEIAEASRTLLPLHPRMKYLASQLAGLDGQIRDAADRAARASENDARRARDEADPLASKLAEQSKAAASPSTDDAPLHALEAEAQAARDELKAYQQMAREDEARAAAEPPDRAARIVARAEPPSAPIFAEVWPTLLAGTAAGFVLSTLAAAAAAFAARGRRQDAPPAPAPAGPDLAAPPDASEPTPSEISPAGALTSVDDLVETLRRLKPHDRLVVLVAGDQTGQALPVALETARRLALERAAVFVDLGDTQDWLGDILYREQPGDPAVLGLTDLIAGRAGFGEVMRRDLSSSLDVVLPGRGGASGSLGDALTAFSAAYSVVVLHASNWRRDWARSAAAHADAVVVVAPAARADAALGAVEAQLRDACPAFLVFAVRAAQRAPEPVA